jgi:(p)ppGpp synthase/HD superfamily hydrolase
MGKGRTVTMHRFPRLPAALAYAALHHDGQLRKGTNIPYLAHLLGVCALVLDYGGDEDQAIAGLLHDVIEDCGEQHRAVVRAMFGDRVADIVEGCTDGVPDSDGVKAPWRERKTAYLAHLRDAPPDTLLVSACDRLHNARAIAADVRGVGADVFTRFKAGRDGTLWYYGALLDVFGARMGQGDPLVVELRAAVGDMRG